MKILSRLASGAVIVGIVATSQVLMGCGLKGPLYRPGERSQKDSAATPAPGSSKPPMSQRAPAPQAQKNDTTAPSAATPAVDPDRPAEPPAGTP